MSDATTARRKLRDARERLKRPNESPEYYAQWERIVSERAARLAALGVPEDAPPKAQLPIETRATVRNDAHRSGALASIGAIRVAKMRRTGDRVRHVLIGMGGSFYNPSAALAGRINDALGPSESDSGRFVRRRRERKPKLSPFVVNGKFATQRYRDWTPFAVAKAGDVGRAFLRWVLDTAPDALLPAPDRRLLLMALAATGGAA